MILFAKVRVTYNCYCYLIIRNAEASLVKIESREYEYKQCIFSRNIAPQIPTPEKWNITKTTLLLVISFKMLKYLVKNKKPPFNV